MTTATAVRVDSASTDTSPAWLDDAIARATALLPADRFSRASQLAEALEPPRPSRAMAG